MIMLANKAQILRMVGKLPDNVTYDRILYHLDVLLSIESGMDQIKHGEVIDHDDLIVTVRHGSMRFNPDQFLQE